MRLIFSLSSFASRCLESVFFVFFTKKNNWAYRELTWLSIKRKHLGTQTKKQKLDKNEIGKIWISANIVTVKTESE